MGLLTAEDVDKIAEALPTNTSALVLLFEHRWAVAIKEAIGAAGGFLVSRTTIPAGVARTRQRRTRRRSGDGLSLVSIGKGTEP